MTSELKDCPFCHAVGEVSEQDGGPGETVWFALCTDDMNCGILLGPFEGEEEARKAWNRRPISVEEVARAGKRASTTTDSGTATQILERGLRALGIEVEDDA